MKKIKHIKKSKDSHWVGDGFPVRTIFSYNDLENSLSPFLLMDYAGPYEFTPTENKRGVGEHPHRGFETVTIVYSGEVEHRDSSGGGGVINEGDVQWMTAASGLVHEEFHTSNFSKAGGRFEMVQLWVNLPKKFKMTKPRYQGIKSSDIPTYSLEDGKVQIRVIAGEYNDKKGPALTYSPINLWDIRVKAGTSVNLDVPKDHSASLFVLDGQINIGDDSIIEAQLAVFESEKNTISFKAIKDSKILFLGGEIIDEPVVGYGPFVMNSKEEIQQAITDYNSGKMGKL